MNKLLKLSCLSLFLALVMSSCSSQKKYSYETVPNDPLKARIYTLDNGLKVYLTVNKETPRIQTFIAVSYTHLCGNIGNMIPLIAKNFASVIISSFFIRWANSVKVCLSSVNKSTVTITIT